LIAGAQCAQAEFEPPRTVLCSLLILLSLMSPDLDPPPKYKAWVQDHEVWIDSSAGRRRVLFDGLAAQPAAVSPKGDRVVYAIENPNTDEHCNNTPQQYIALSSNSGSPLWKVGLDNCNEFSEFEWIDEYRIGAKLCGHANCFYWVLDATSGKVLQQLTGGFDFLWSHNRQFVAHHIPFYTEERSSVLGFGDEMPVYPKPDSNTGRIPVVDIGDLTWSPDDAWVSFPETDYPSYNSFVVLVSPEGKVLRDSLPVDVNDAVIQWTNSTHFQITASGRTFSYRVEGGKLQEIVHREPPALH
jgi:hypothetical protein